MHVLLRPETNKPVCIAQTLPLLQTLASTLKLSTPKRCSILRPFSRTPQTAKKPYVIMLSALESPKITHSNPRRPIFVLRKIFDGSAPAYLALQRVRRWWRGHDGAGRVGGSRVSASRHLAVPLVVKGQQRRSIHFFGQGARWIGLLAGLNHRKAGVKAMCQPTGSENDVKGRIARGGRVLRMYGIFNTCFRSTIVRPGHEI